jgi:methylated-DNA-protein-cysteine methyltransferase-like protein
MRFFERVYAVVQCIPPGRVATYGQIARLLGQPHAARTVGWALRGVPQDSAVPWQRVVNASGSISIRDLQGSAEQRTLLVAEGVIFGSDGRIDLDRFRWDGLSEFEIRLLIESLEEPGAHT